VGLRGRIVVLGALVVAVVTVMTAATGVPMGRAIDAYEASSSATSTIATTAAAALNSQVPERMKPKLIPCGSMEGVLFLQERSSCRSGRIAYRRI
jgi:hypothetical protein